MRRIWEPSRSIKRSWNSDGSINCARRSQSRSPFCKKKIAWTSKLFGSNTFNKLNHFHHNKVSKFCEEAGFMRVVEVGQYFVTKNTGNLTHFRSVVCREYILLRDDPDFQPKRWIQGNMRIGLVWEVTTSFQHFKYEIEVRIWSVNQDNSLSWVRISYGTVRYVIDSIQDNMEIPADLQEEQVPQTSIKKVAVRSKAKEKTTTESSRWHNSNHTKTWKKMDWHWAIKTRTCLVQSFKKKWSIFCDTIKRYRGKTMEQLNLQDKITSSKSSFTNTSLVW